MNFQYPIESGIIHVLLNLYLTGVLSVFRIRDRGLVRWGFVRWDFLRWDFCPLGFSPLGFLSAGIFSVGILSVGVLSGNPTDHLHYKTKVLKVRDHLDMRDTQTLSAAAINPQHQLQYMAHHLHTPRNIIITSSTYHTHILTSLSPYLNQLPDAYSHPDHSLFHPVTQGQHSVASNILQNTALQIISMHQQHNIHSIWENPVQASRTITTTTSQLHHHITCPVSPHLSVCLPACLHFPPPAASLFTVLPDTLITSLLTLLLLFLLFLQCYQI